MNTTKAVCLVTLIPNKIWCDFLTSFNTSTYTIYVVVDDNNFDLSQFITEYDTITFIQVENKKCSTCGYVDTSFTLKKLISGWDKALYYFGIENKIHDHIWFMEDDVFFYNALTLEAIDCQYTDGDLLSNCYEENVNGDRNTWHWRMINIRQYPPPYYNSMVCVVRISRKMMNCINNYASSYKTLFFLEALFPTIAIKNNLKYICPVEFRNIHYREFNRENINGIDLYHPVKDLNHHILFRNELDICRS